MQLEEGWLERSGGICYVVVKDRAGSQSGWEGEEELLALCYRGFIWIG